MWRGALLAGGAALLLTVAASAKTAGKSHRTAKASVHASGHHGSRKSGKKSRKSASWRRGQQRMDSARVQQIQAALVREHYLEGAPSGVWDQKSKDAMARYQADNGWQTKSLPDARALIRLGLGPDPVDLINPDTAMTSSPGGGAEKPQPGIYQPQ